MNFKLGTKFYFLPKSKRAAKEGQEIGMYPFFTSSNIVDKYVDTYDYDGEYLIIGDGGTGNCKYYSGKFSASDHNYVIKSNSLFPAKLVRYFLMKDNFKVLNEGFKGVGLKNVSKNYISNISVYINDHYNLEEIVFDLDNINKIIYEIDFQIGKCDELVKSRFVEMFNNKGFDKTTLGEISERITKGSTPTTYGFQFLDSGINFIKIESIGENHLFIPEKFAFIGSDCHNSFKRSQLENGDLLFSIAGALGRTALVTNDILPANTNQALAIIKIKNNYKVSKKFLLAQFDTEFIKEQIEKDVVGAAQKNLSLQNISDMEVIIPPFELQNEFTEFVEMIDKSKFNERRISLCC